MIVDKAEVMEGNHADTPPAVASEALAQDGSAVRNGMPPVEGTNEPLPEGFGAPGESAEADAGDESLSEPADEEDGVSEDVALPAEPAEEEVRLEAARIAEETDQVREHLAQLQHGFAQFRRRTEEQQARWAPRARASVLEASLTVFDDLCRWLEATPAQQEDALSTQQFEALRQGAELVHDSFAAMVGRFSATPPKVPGPGPGEGESVEERKIAEKLVSGEEESVGPEAELEQVRKRLRSAAAEYKAYKRWAKAERRREEQRARSSVVQALTEVLQTLRSLLDEAEGMEATADAAEAYAHLEGAMEEVSGSFRDALEQFGITRILADGQPFAVERHEAVGQAPATDLAPGTVMYEVRRGYMLEDRVLRYAQVIVAA